MASVFGWWRALLAIIQARQDTHWIEPSNEITRAILSGQVPTVGRHAVHVTAATAVVTEGSLAATPAIATAEPVVAEPGAATTVETPATTEAPARSRRRRSHRAA